MESGAQLLVAALAIDAVLGEPPARLHPVVWMGRAIGAAERRLRGGSPVRELAGGAAMALGIPLAFALATALLIDALRPHPFVSYVVLAWLLKSTFALRALGRAGDEVRRPLIAGDLRAARAALRGLCSRDPARLDEQQVTGAAVSSLAENASDSFVAPLLFYAVGGLPAAVAYRAVNTLDAMIGYRGRDEWLGKAAARLDDLLNLVPARLTAAALLAAGALLGHDAGRGATVLARDGGRTASPNGGRPMAAMAGLLGVRLEKPGHYALGDPGRALVPDDIRVAWAIVRLAAALVALGVGGLLLLAGRHG